MISAGLKLDVYFGESLTSGGRTADDALMDCFAAHELQVAALYRGIEGFGIGRPIHTSRFPDVSADLPLVAEAIDSRERIEATLPDVHAIVDKGLVPNDTSLMAGGAAGPPAAAGAAVPRGGGRGEGRRGAGGWGRFGGQRGGGARRGTTTLYRAVFDL